MTARAPRPPTDRQRAILEFIAGVILLDGYPPSMREIGAAFGVSLNGVNDHLRALVRKGLIERDPRTSRGTRITPVGRKWLSAEVTA